MGASCFLTDPDRNLGSEGLHEYLLFLLDG
jgi:hypothetical protein